MIAAIFLVVVLSGLAVFAVRIGVLQQQASSSQLLAAQALHAARSGIAWAARRAIADGWCGTVTLTLSEGGANGFDVAVSCSQSAHDEQGATTNVYIINALAEFGSYGGPDYVSRRLEAKITDAS